MNCYIETLGCPKNTADSESTAGILERAGHLLVKEAENADVILVNTCGFIQDAKEESIDRIFELCSHKERGAKIVVTGCLSQRYGKQLAKLMPEVDLFLGVNDYIRLPELLREVSVTGGETETAGKAPKLALSPWCREYEELGRRTPLGPRYTAYLKISEGCNNVCAYCVIPSIRGPYRSRRQEEILAEARDCATRGCKELILVAQDVTAYGMDFDGNYHLAELLTELCEIEGIHWIRLLYCYEDRITDELIRVIRDNPKICPYLDIPIQHASDRVLSSMNRRSTETSIRKTIENLRASIPGVCIRTTLITGFPGEKTEDFEILESFVRETKFDRLGVFAYSKEEGTPAAAMKGQVREATKIRRRDRIMELQREISLEHNREKVGTILEVLVEEQDEEGAWIGRSRFDAPEIDNSVIIYSQKPHQSGDLISVRVTDAFDYDLIGEEAEQSESAEGGADGGNGGTK